MSYSFQNLKIQAAGQTVENAFLKQNETSQNLAVIFPGAGYTTMGPMLYYIGQTLVERGDDVLLVEYKSALSADPSRVGEIAVAAITEGLRQGSYERIILVGKSLGTRALAHLSRTKNSWNGDDKPIRSIWLTPLLGDPALVSEIGKLGDAQFLATGTEDHPHYQANALSGLSESVETFVIPGADHGLDIPGDVLASIRTMEELVRRVIEFAY
jgi:hypothetical protein